MTETDWHRALAELRPGAEVAMRAMTGVAGVLRLLRDDNGECVARWELSGAAVEATARTLQQDGTGHHAALATVDRAITYLIRLVTASPPFCKAAAQRVQ